MSRHLPSNFLRTSGLRGPQRCTARPVMVGSWPEMLTAEGSHCRRPASSSSSASSSRALICAICAAESPIRSPQRLVLQPLSDALDALAPSLATGPAREKHAQLASAERSRAAASPPLPVSSDRRASTDGRAAKRSNSGRRNSCIDLPRSAARAASSSRTSQELRGWFGDLGRRYEPHRDYCLAVKIPR